MQGYGMKRPATAPDMTRLNGLWEIEGLEEFLQELGLSDRLEVAAQWCEEQHVRWLEEVAESMDDLAGALGLSEDEVLRVERDLPDALSTAMRTGTCSSHFSRQISDDNGTATMPLRKLFEQGAAAADGGAPSLKLRTKTMTLEASATGSRSRRNSITIAGPVRSHLGALKITQSELSIKPMQRSQIGANAAACVDFGEEDEDECVPRCFSSAYVGRMGRNNSMSSSTVSSMAIGSFMSDPSRSMACHKGARNRRNTIGEEGPSARDAQKVEVQGSSPVNLDAGQTGTVYALESGDKKVAIFKPLDGEDFKRRSLNPGQGAIREEAAYLVDRICGSQAHVPVTSRASIHVEGKELEGSIQKFVSEVAGFADDFGMPRDLASACGIVPQETVEALALLDMRIFNTDRHGGNLLILGQQKPHGLGPIDHGCCLPPWYSLGEAVFDAWSSWPQLKSSPSEYACKLASTAAEKLPQTCKTLEELGLEGSSIITLRLCTRLIYNGVSVHHIPIGKLAVLLLRDEEECFEELSWLEEKVFHCARDAGAKITLGKNDRGEQELVLEDPNASLDEEKFFAGFEAVLQKELKDAIELCMARRESNRFDAD
jgi:hypothetical protein